MSKHEHPVLPATLDAERSDFRLSIKQAVFLIGALVAATFSFTVYWTSLINELRSDIGKATGAIEEIRKNMWTMHDESDSWQEFKDLNPDKALKTPKVSDIHRSNQK